ncbi:hypothetical protein E4L96_20145 [Massilia arenosa]|uniref:Uncharacterized protein n=1 Tax=Zemynaea arenosa TaxID=2561931 RepID=A0A4Y9RW87_9BURK|nr:hypothetical protein [Massilia arenosa]TFW13410.1 hypothetical protein E4L96_20145 [Massilia arenosa]
MVKFTFNRKARATAIAAIKKLETGSFMSAVLGAFGANPRVTAVAALAVFILCRIGETVIAGIVDHPDGTPEHVAGDDDMP